MQVKKLSVYPFKSLRGFDVDEWEVDQYGLKYDRMFMLVNQKADGEWSFLTQRTLPSMARIKTQIVEPFLELTYDGGPKIQIPLDTTEINLGRKKPIELQLWYARITCLDVSTDETKQFFVDFFNDPKLRLDNLAVVTPLVRRALPDNMAHTRDFLNHNPRQASFQDVWPCSLMCTESFIELARQVENLDESANISEDSFRMNIVVETDEAWTEDDWKLVKIGNHEYVVDSPRQRCPVPSVDQQLGEFRPGRHPVPSLNRFRILERGQRPSFGISLVNKDEHYKIRVGDSLQILEQEDSI